MVLGKKNRVIALNKVAVNIPMQDHPAARRIRRRSTESSVFFVTSNIWSTNIYEYMALTGRECKILKEMKKSKRYS